MTGFMHAWTQTCVCVCARACAHMHVLILCGLTPFVPLRYTVQTRAKGGVLPEMWEAEPKAPASVH